MHALKDESASAPSATPDEAATPGWDPRRIWQDRVQLPRLAGDLPHDAAPETPIDATGGWDPFQTWQYRVLRGLAEPR